MDNKFKFNSNTFEIKFRSCQRGERRIGDMYLYILFLYVTFFSCEECPTYSKYSLEKNVNE